MAAQVLRAPRRYMCTCVCMYTHVAHIFFLVSVSCSRAELEKQDDSITALRADKQRLTSQLRRLEEEDPASEQVCSALHVLLLRVVSFVTFIFSLTFSFIQALKDMEQQIEQLHAAQRESDRDIETLQQARDAAEHALMLARERTESHQQEHVAAVSRYEEAASELREQLESREALVSELVAMKAEISAMQQDTHASQELERTTQEVLYADCCFLFCCFRLTSIYHVD